MVAWFVKSINQLLTEEGGLEGAPLSGAYVSTEAVALHFQMQRGAVGEPRHLHHETRLCLGESEKMGYGKLAGHRHVILHTIKPVDGNIVSKDR